MPFNNSLDDFQFILNFYIKSPDPLRGILTAQYSSYKYAKNNLQSVKARTYHFMLLGNGVLIFAQRWWENQFYRYFTKSSKSVQQKKRRQFQVWLTVRDLWKKPIILPSRTVMGTRSEHLHHPVEALFSHKVSKP